MGAAARRGRAEGEVDMSEEGADPTVPGSAPSVVLSLNVGSSSLKATVRDPAVRMHAEATGLDGATGRLVVTGTGAPAEEAPVADGWGTALPMVADAMSRRGIEPQVVAHRIVHGSAALVTVQRADDHLLRQLQEEAHLDPLHLPRQLDALDQARALWPDADVVLVPDDLFHRSLPDEAVTLPLPAEVRASGMRVWGFHGLAVQSVVDQLPGLGSAVVVHLGSGCSVTAVQGVSSRATSMSLSPAGGIPSVTRSGDLDPEVVLRLVDTAGSVAAARELLNRRSGLSGLSGGRTDVRQLLAAADPAADLALRVFVRHVAMAVAAAVTTLDRWDTLVFTGGIGLHSEEIRERVCARLLSLRPGARECAGPPSERLVGTGLRVCTVPVDEEAVMDRYARAMASRAAVSSEAPMPREPAAPAHPAAPVASTPPVRVLVAAASRHGATAELAVAIADGVRRASGGSAEVVVRRPGEVTDVADYDAVVLGSAVYFGHWLEEAHDLLLRCAVGLWERPVWLFSSGPVGIPERPPEALLDVDEELRLARAREHRIFPGRLERDRLDLAERAMVAALRAPEGDFRSWAAAKAWGESIGTALSAERAARDLAVDA
jgi:acetate kinase